MNRKVSELSGAWLDYFVARIVKERRGLVDHLSISSYDQETLDQLSKQAWTREIKAGEQVCFFGDFWFRPSIDWSVAGPLIEENKIQLIIGGNLRVSSEQYWIASIFMDLKNPEMAGETALIAAMRCLVSSRYGREVEC